MRVEIDAHSGFCGGVIRAIGKAEEALRGRSRIYSLGEIVHNEAELRRLASEGLEVVSGDGLSALAPGDSLLVRAHGEPPETYARARSMGLDIIDCTCPVVLGLQKTIREAYARLKGRGTVVIFGKIGHAEVLGLIGQVAGDAVVVENVRQLESHLDSGDIAGAVEVFSQTTMSPVEYEMVCRLLGQHIPDVTVHDTICRQVAYRQTELEEFARAHDVLVFVSGAQSSNGRVLYELCRSVNPRTHHVGDASRIECGWFRPEDSVGVCGATSTPKWLLEEVAATIEKCV